MFGLLPTRPRLSPVPGAWANAVFDAIAVSRSLVLERVQLSLHDQTDKIVVKYKELFSVFSPIHA